MKKILCWLLAFLLTCTLALFGFSYVAARAVDPALKEGEWRELTEEELGSLRRAAGLDRGSGTEDV